MSCFGSGIFLKSKSHVESNLHTFCFLNFGNCFNACCGEVLPQGLFPNLHFVLCFSWLFSQQIGEENY